MTEKWRQQTRLVRDGLSRSEFDETAEALFVTSGYVYQSAEEARAAFAGDVDHYIYSRYGNPTVTMFEERLRTLEGAEACRATASGMAAVFASLLCQLRAGDRVVSARALFGSCLYIVEDLLPRWGIETVLVDGTDMDQWVGALATPAQVVFFESPSNPMLEIIDIAAVSELAHAAGAAVVVDNVFATPLLQQPFELGADVVVYSTTKHIDGQGRTIGGAVLATEAFIEEHYQPFMRHTGPTMSPFTAWVLVKGLETLQLRIDAQSKAALVIAAHLATLPGVDRVVYPMLPGHPQAELASRQMKAGGTLVTLELDGGLEPAFAFLNALELFDISNNLGDSKSLAVHPATTTHQRLTPEQRAHLGITDGVVRLSIGLEDIADLIEDLERAASAI